MISKSFYLWFNLYFCVAKNTLLLFQYFASLYNKMLKEIVYLSVLCVCEA